MKMDKIRFAQLVNFLSRHGMYELSLTEMQELDDIVQIDIPAPVNNYPDADDINRLMALMTEGTQKIEAIKLHRKLSGCGLKESKDMVEKYWPNTAVINRIKDALGTAEDGLALVEVARNAHRAERELASMTNAKDSMSASLGDILSEATRDKYVDG